MKTQIIIRPDGSQEFQKVIEPHDMVHGVIVSTVGVNQLLDSTAGEHIRELLKARGYKDGLLSLHFKEQPLDRMIDLKDALQMFEVPIIDFRIEL